MVGSKLRNSLQSEKRRREGLNSTNRNSTVGTLKRFLSRALLIGAMATGITGVTMAQTTREAHAQESRGNAAATTQAMGVVGDRLTAARSALSEMESAGVPAQLNYNSVNGAGEPVTHNLLDAIATLAERLREAAGRDVIPLTGSTDQERFRSLNNWLRRPQDSPLDSDALDLLQRRLMEASGTASSHSATGPVVAVVPAPTAPVAAQPAQPETVQPAQPAPVVEQPATHTLTAEQTQLLENLETIAASGRNARVRGQAARLVTRINGEVEREGGPREAQLRRLTTAAQTLVTAELARAQTRAAERRASVGAARAPTPAEQAVDTRITEILTNVQEVASATGVTPERRDLANSVGNMLGDARLLGEDPMVRMVTLLGEARDALVAGNDTLAQTKRDEARAIFTAEQASMRRQLEQIIIPVAQGCLTAIDGSNLPTRADLTAAEGRDRSAGVRRGQYSRSSNGLRNGREDIRATMDARMTAARQMLASATSGDDISYHAFAELFESVRLEETMIRTMIDLWDYGQSHGADTADPSRRVGLYTRYSIAAMTIVDANFSPLGTYTADTRRAMARAYLRLRSGTTPSAAQVTRAMRDLLPALMRSKEYRYDDVLHQLYGQISELAPSTTTPEITRVATLRSLRIAATFEYEPYRSGRRFEYDPSSGLELAVELDQQERQSQDRLTMATEFLQSVIAASGMPADDPMIEAANTRLTAAAGAQAADIPELSDALYNMALALSSIGEAQVFRQTASMRRDVPAAELQHADLLIAQAVESYMWAFSVPTVDSGFHPNMAQSLANEAINILAPVALQTTESPAMYVAISAYDNPGEVGIVPADLANPTAAERRQAAQRAEERYLRFLVSLRTDTSFGVSTLRGRPSFGAMSLLDPRVLRNRTIITLGGHPIYEKNSLRGRTTETAIDQHVVPLSEPEAELRNNAHENLQLAQWGELYQELYRLTLLHGNDETPQLLRGIDPAPLRAQMEQMARGYSSATAAQQLQRGNQILIEILDARILELTTRLDGNVTLAGGQVFRRRELARSTSPEALYVTRAVETLERLTAVRAGLHSDRASAISDGRITPRLAIGMAEIAIESLDDDHLTGLNPPPAPPTISLRAHVPSDAIEVERLSGNPRRVRFRATRVMIAEEGGSPVTLAEYQRTHGEQNLTYYWFHYQDLGRRDSARRPIQYLLNPRYRERGQPRYLGQVMRGVTLTDGTVGDFVVRVRRTGLEPSQGPEWAPVVDSRGRPTDVLYAVTFDSDGQALPVNDARLRATMGRMPVARERASSVDTVVEFATTTPVVIVSPSPTRR